MNLLKMLVNCGKDRKMKCPPFLKPADRVRILATARKVSKAEMQTALEMLSACSWQVEEAEHLYAAHHQFAGNDEERCADLQKAMNDPDIKAIFIARGGYGTMRLLDQLLDEAFLKHPKWVVGYSDVTALHAWIQKRGIASMHATMPINFSLHEGATQALLDALTGKCPAYGLKPQPLQIRGSAKGILFGGNLSLIYALQGSPEAHFPEGGILFLEDLDEYLYHVDRMMMNLKRSGLLNRISGLVVGGMSDMKDNAIPFGRQAEEIIHDAVKDLGIPVCFGFPAGHIPENMPMIFGAMHELKVADDKVELIRCSNEREI
jgi:muramoyltetrapeptide carboxypeptidase